MEKQIKENLKEIVKNNFISLTYREKYNLTFNDKRILSISEYDMYLDLMITYEFKKYVKKKMEDIDEFDFNIEDDEENYSLNDLRSGKVNHIHVGGFSKEEIEEFWNDDTIYK